jgi:hypothetical protein
VAAETADRPAAPGEIDAMTDLATGQVSVGSRRVLIEPTHGMRLPRWGGIGIAVRAADDGQQRKQNQQWER